MGKKIDGQPNSVANLVYLFSQGGKDMRALLGGKGANLAEMTKIGLPVPPGFTVTTTACNEYFNNEGQLPEDLLQEIYSAMSILENETGKKFGDPINPLLVSVRSGAVVSMPGMMDTVLNLGLNDESMEGLTKKTDNRRFALDSYRRFIQMFSDVVLGIEPYLFEHQISNVKSENKVKEDTELDEKALTKLIEKFKAIVKQQIKEEFPQDPQTQLTMAIKAVFDSWNNQRAQVYREIHGISAELGTAVNVQSMVFGNMGNDSGTGVAFTRNPSTGERETYGEFLLNAQGEDVVAGTRTPKALSELQTDFPEVYQQFIDVSQLMENHYRDMQDIEFTVENKKLYLLQTRNGKRTAAAAVKIAVEMAEENVISREEALFRVEPKQIAHLLHPQIDQDQEFDILTNGLPASPGAATGKIVFDSNEAELRSQNGEKVILVRPETTPDDLHGIVASQGILTSRGGMTSHAAVVARGMGIPCVCGCEGASIDLNRETLEIGNRQLSKGDLISIDGATGRAIFGEVKLSNPGLGEESSKLLAWADDISSLGVRANADTPGDAAKALDFGATGIGLCRTEHMFMGPERLPKVQDMILADQDIDRNKALDALLPYQEEDFYGILREMDGLPTTIRLLDPPLHEFLPDGNKLEQELNNMNNDSLADKQEIAQTRKMLEKIRSLEESNPMLGFRGCRLGMIYPEIYEMQVKAIVEATNKLVSQGYKPHPEIMIPLIGHTKELEVIKEHIIEVIEEYSSSQEIKTLFHIGTMIELPRACLTADQIAELAEFISFGTNDLTQTTLGYSRDDAESKFLAHYMQNDIIPHNPFMVLDHDGVGELVKTAVEKAKKSNPSIKKGICGEHGGDPESIEFFHSVGLDYVSCSPYRVPVARLASAQAELNSVSH